MKTLLISALLLIVATAAQAQENYFYAAWNYKIPTVNTNWLNSPSGYGGVAGYRFFVKEQKLSVGVEVNWSTFDQYEPKQTFQQPDGAITTDYFKYIYQYGIAATVQYHFPVGASERFFPYGGLGLGANYSDFTLYYNIYSDREGSWGFLARPELGTVVRFNPDRALGLIAAVHYDYSTNKNETYDYDKFSALGFKLGVVLMNR